MSRLSSILVVLLAVLPLFNKINSQPQIEIIPSAVEFHFDRNWMLVDWSLVTIFNRGEEAFEWGIQLEEISIPEGAPEVGHWLRIENYLREIPPGGFLPLVFGCFGEDLIDGDYEVELLVFDFHGGGEPFARIPISVFLTEIDAFPLRVMPPILDYNVYYGALEPERLYTLQVYMGNVVRMDYILDLMNIEPNEFFSVIWDNPIDLLFGEIVAISFDFEGDRPFNFNGVARFSASPADGEEGTIISLPILADIEGDAEAVSRQGLLQPDNNVQMYNFPNPFNDRTTLFISHPPGEYFLTVSDLTGRIYGEWILSSPDERMNNIYFDFKNSPTGLYLVRLMQQQKPVGNLRLILIK